jgi:hypothetical protein
VTWNSLIRLAKKKYGLKKVIWVYNKNYLWWGQSQYTEGIVRLNYHALKHDDKLKAQVLFHELGHIWCYENGIWESYHQKYEPRTRREKERFLRTALKAERWIDRWAEKKVKEIYPDHIYRWGYLNKENVKLFKDKHLTKYKI